MGRRSKPWFRKSDGWWYSTIGARKVRLAEGEGSRKAAELRFHELKAAEGAIPTSPLPHSPTITLGALADAHFEGALRGAAADTLANYRRYVGDFLSHTGKATEAAGVRPMDVGVWLDGHAGWGPSTRRLAISQVKAIFNWGLRQGLLETDPLARMVRPPPKAREKAMDAETFRVVMAGISKRGKTLHDFLTFMFETGCRPSEAMRLEAAHLDLAARVATMPSKTTRRTGKPRKIHLTPKTVDICARLMKKHRDGPILRNAGGKPWTRDSLASRFYRMRKKLGLPKGICPETLRHGFITDALERGVHPATVAALVGHRDLTMIMQVYSKLHDRSDHLKEGLGKIRPGD